MGDNSLNRITRKVIMVKCTGEAHSPEVAGHIDHCLSCAPYWEEYPICPRCESKVKQSKHGKYSFYCRRCKLWLMG